MILKNTQYFINNYFFFNNFFLQKFFSKFIFMKFLILKKCLQRRRNKFIIIDNFFDCFIFCLKIKYKKLGLSYRLKTAFFFKTEFFIYKSSKLSQYSFTATMLKTYIKKPIYLNLNNLKNSILHFGLLFVYKSTRGGFYGFTNKITGFLPTQYLILLKPRLIFYKKYFIITKGSCAPYTVTKLPMFLYYNSGFIRNYSFVKTNKKQLRQFFFKKFNFIFSFKKIFLKKYLQYFLMTLLSSRISSNKNLFFYFYSLILKLIFILKK